MAGLSSCPSIKAHRLPVSFYRLTVKEAEVFYFSASFVLIIPFAVASMMIRFFRPIRPIVFQAVCGVCFFQPRYQKRKTGLVLFDLAVHGLYQKIQRKPTDGRLREGMR